MGKRTRAALALAEAQAAESTPAFLQLQDKDEGLDAIFTKTFAPVEKYKPVPLPVAVAEAPPVVEEPTQKVNKKRKAPPAVNVDENEPEEVYIAKQVAKKLKAAQAEPVVTKEKKFKKGSRVVESDSDSSEAEEAIESSAIEQDHTEEATIQEEQEEEESDSDPAQLIHETLLQPAKPDEDASLRDVRTAFIGNLPISAATSKPLRKSLLALITSSLPSTSKIDSIRFRSLPLANTTPIEKKPKEPSHSRKRAQTWAETSLRKGGTKTDINPNSVSLDSHQKEVEAPKVYLTTAQKRKVAFITGDHLLDPTKIAGASCTAYVVLSTPQDVDDLIEKMDGALWEERTLRVDKVVKTAKGWEEEKRTVFVGGLDFETSEEALRSWMEATLVKEKGEADEGAWVLRVRIIKDKQTGLGKGFAYVLFKERDCVDEVLALDPAQCKMDKRKLRFERCKNAAKLEALKKIAERKEKATAGKAGDKKAYNSDAAPIKRKKPKIDLGKELEGKPKDERKAIKSQDIERVQRRLEKKQKKAQDLKRASRKQQRSEASLLATAAKRVKGVENSKGAKLKKKSHKAA